MNKKELTAAIAEKSGMTQKDAGNMVNLLVGEIVGALTKRERIQIAGLGTFSVKERAERIWTNPTTQKKMTVKASIAPAFKAGKELKELLNK